jgi:hypothetical protein
MIRWLIFALLAAILPAQAAQWQHTLATTASLRTDAG